MEMRKRYQEVLADLLKQDSRVVMMDADLASASGSGGNFKQFPQRCINVGISEANMISSAAGLSRTGLLPYVHSFAPFVTRRVLDQIFMSGVYSKNRIHIYGSEPGFWAQQNGGTHTSYEDIALLRTLPDAVVTAPCDPVQFAFVLKEFTKHQTVFYTRAPRKELPDIYDESQQFALGTMIAHGKGTDCIIFAFGEMMHEALQAQKSLAQEGIQTTVLDCFSVKPFDEKTAKQYISQTTVVITIENHSIIGGLHSIVSDVMSQFHHQAITIPIAVMDTFGEVGTDVYLKQKHQLTANRIIEVARTALGK